MLDHYDRAAIDASSESRRRPADGRRFGTNPSLRRLQRQPGSVTAPTGPAISSRNSSKRRGYDLTPYLPALAGDIGEKTMAVRHDWGKTLTELADENYLKPIARVGAAARHALPLADLRHAAGGALEQRAGRSARRRRHPMAAASPARAGQPRRAIFTAGR